MREMRGQAPFRDLGTKLRGLRRRHKKSLEEVSYAIEIDPETLHKYESGKDRPDPDILDILLRHLKVGETEGEKLWEIAGYGEGGLDDIMSKQIAFVLPIENRVIYSDKVQAMVNEKGVVLNFMQQDNGPDGQPLVASRIGMSKVQAKALIKLLEGTVNGNKSEEDKTDKN